MGIFDNEKIAPFITCQFCGNDMEWISEEEFVQGLVITYDLERTDSTFNSIDEGAGFWICNAEYGEGCGASTGYKGHQDMEARGK